MLSQAQIKYIRALQQKKFRMLHGSFVVEGEKIIAELLNSRFQTSGIFALKSWLDTNRHQVPHDTPVYEVSAKDLDRISGMPSPNQVLAVVKIPDNFHLVVDQWDGMALYLDGIRDPGNLGTIIRTADWFGVDRIYCSDDTAELFNPKVIQASMGSFLRVHVIPIPLDELLQSQAKLPIVYGAMLEGENIHKLIPEEPALLLIGNESKGISPELQTYITRKVMIPGQKHRADSLNASIAAAILMSWYHNQ